MPRLSDSMEEGTILSWLKADGETVAEGDELVEIETDKATMTYESPASGTLTITAAAGASLPVGAVIAHVGAGAAAAASAPAATGGGASTTSSDAAGSPASAPTDGGASATSATGNGAAGHGVGRPDQRARSHGEPGADAAGADAAVAPSGANGHGGDADVLATPLARRIAAAHGIDLTTVRGSGPRGRVTRADVAAAAGITVPAPAASAAAPTAGVASVAAGPAGVGMSGAVGAQAATPATAPGGLAAPTATTSAASGVSVPGGTGAATTATPTAVTQASADGARVQELTRLQQTSADGARVQELTRLQQTVARRMAEAKATVPEFQVQTEVVMDAALALRAQLKAAAGEGGVAPSVNDLIVKAAALALREHPLANGSYRDGHFELHPRVNVGIAVAAEGALVVPTITDADIRSLGSIAAEARRLAARVRDNTITPPELSGGTFTVSNLGMYGMTAITPVINLPQAAILGVGAVRDVLARGDDGEIVDRKLMTLTLTCDHRILYGADAAQFLATIRDLLEHPLRLTL